MEIEVSVGGNRGVRGVVKEISMGGNRGVHGVGI